MRRVTGLTLLLLLSLFTANAQQRCGTDPTDVEYDKIIADRQVARAAMAAESGASTTRWIPLKMHLVGMDDSTGYHPNRKVLKIMCELNDWMVGSDLQFYLFEGIHYIASDYYYDFTQSARIEELERQYNVESNVLDVYINNNPTDGLCGRSAFTTSALPHGIIMKKSCSEPGGTTFPHEIGHYFNLFHTFQSHGSKNLNRHEFVTRIDSLKNCETAGDGFCDTEADYLSNRWECIGAVHTQVDKMDTVYRPDETLIMSYASDHCVSRFSPEEEAHMNYVAAYGGRSEMLNFPLPKRTPITDKPDHVAPWDGETDLPANDITFRWNAVPGANGYHLIATRFSLNSDIKLAVDIIVEDTFYRAKNHEFDELRNYEWIVKPFNEGYTCADYSNSTSFTTGFKSDLSSIGSVSSPVDVRLYPNPVSSSGSIFIESSEPLESLEILQTTGALVTIYNNPGRRVELPQLPAGMYLVRSSTEEGVAYSRVAINQ